ncbi:MAG: THUMP-like domain-containing protein [Sciscionella sp.]
MSYRFDAEDVRYLRSRAGVAALALVSCLPLTDASRLSDVAAARKIAGQRGAAVLETALLRRRAGAKLADADGWLFTDAALQQATATPVARYRAERLAGRDVHDVTCSIGADVIELARVAPRCLGSDVDGVRLAMARHNCGRAEVLPTLLHADALRPVSRDTVVVADPARRDARGRRTLSARDVIPPLDELETAYAGRELAVKCAPGLDFTTVRWAGEVEVISYRSHVREACLWTGDLATAGRRATVLRRDGSRWTITDAEADDCEVRAPGEWLIEPDGAVIRAGLVRHYAARHGLGQLDARIAYLTGDAPPAGVRAFRVLEHGKYTEKAVRAMLRRHDVGRLEIMVRGLDIGPDDLRRRLRPSGDEEATLVLTRIGRTPAAFLCRAGYA